MVGNVDNGGSYGCVEPGGIWGISVSSSQYCYKPKTGKKKIRSILQKLKCDLWRMLIFALSW